MENQKENWVFVPVAKSRIIKELDKAILLKVDDRVSTILPKVFKRKKESDTHIYFSLPANFVVGFRHSSYDEDAKEYVRTDTSICIKKAQDKLKLLKEDLPF